MGFLAPFVGIFAAGAAVVGTVASISASKKAEKENKRAAEQQRLAYQAEQRRAEVQNVRSIRQQVRAARMAQGQMTNTAALTGGLGGSGLAGGMAAVGGQTAGNLGYMQDIAQQNTAISNAQINSSIFQSRASAAQSAGAIAGQVANLGQTVFRDMYNPSPSSTSSGGFYKFGGSNIDAGGRGE
jgi:hypothetical protein